VIVRAQQLYFGSMRRLSLGRHLVAVCAVVALACHESPPPKPPPPPDADFLLAAGDSTFWVTSRNTGGGIRVRGAPLVVGNWGGRFFEIYVSDDDRSFEDALFIGQRVYRRDLLTGDSLLVFADTLVPRAAKRYAEANPSARPLDPDEEGGEDASTSYTAEVDVLDLYGPYLSYEYHLDVKSPDADAWHHTRRGVIDLRTGKPATLSALFGAAEATRLETAGRTAYRITEDSIRRDPDARAQRATEMLANFHFDPTSFSLADSAGEPEVDFEAPGRGEGGSGFTLPVPTLAAHPPTWWDEVRPTLPTASPDGSVLRWSHGRYRVLARYDSAGDLARTMLSDSTSSHEWDVATVGAPARSIFWLDAPPVDSTARRALARAFDEAAQYDEGTRSTSDVRASRVSPFRFASFPLSSRTREAHPLSSRTGAARVGIYRPKRQAAYARRRAAPETRSLRSLVRDDRKRP
jgi:hypothetical protein